MLLLAGNYQRKKWECIDNHLNEANELTAIFVSILKKLNSKSKLIPKT
jgi:hypothetical protein